MLTCIRHFGSEEMNPPEFAQLTEHHLVLALDASMARPVHHMATTTTTSRQWVIISDNIPNNVKRNAAHYP